MLKEFKSYAKSNLFVDKVIQSKTTFKRGAIFVTEHRLWIYFAGAEQPILVKEDWLTGDNKKDLGSAFKSYISC